MSSQKKRVYCLYRVSTLKQLEKEDIPMQRQVCQEFAESQGWDIVEEKTEKGVSGYKVSASDRDAIQEIQRDALAGKFDILLVFMFDRLGRKEDETPFVVEWFVQNGIEVWSVVEGQQRFDSHVDKLMNYIRYWQASGESIKTSIRTKTRLSQIVQEGRFRGGTVPYGYRIEKQGRLNKQGQEVYEIMVNDDEAVIVKQIFELYLHHGYGSYRICTFLEDNGIRNRSGDNFVNCTIQHMLKNESYTGILKSGETKSDIFPELQIIDPDTFSQVQKMLTERSVQYKERNIPLHTKGQGLLSGNIYCGHCGGRLVQTSNTRRDRNKDGSIKTEYTRIRYICYNKTRHKESCDGQTGYTVSKVDEIIDQVVRNIFDRASDLPQKQLLGSRYNDRIKEMEGRLNTATANLRKRQNELDALKTEMVSVISGKSVLDRETLNEMIMESKQAVEELTAEVNKSTAELENGEIVYAELQKCHDELLSWAELYDTSELEVRKMIVANIIRQIKVRRDYELDIDLNISYSDYYSSESVVESAFKPAT